jgi:hypothetical protein
LIISQAYKNKNIGKKLTLVLFVSFVLSLISASYLMKLDIGGDALGFSILSVWISVYFVGFYWIHYKYVTPEIKRILAVVPN